MVDGLGLERCWSWLFLRICCLSVVTGKGWFPDWVSVGVSGR
jgi:hypothetical protein